MLDDLPSQGFAAIGMGRTSVRVVPRRLAAVAEFAVGAIPGPEFDQRMHPQVQVIDSQVGPDVPHLLLARVPDLLHVVKVLLDRGAVGEGFDDLYGGGVRIGGEEGIPVVILQDDNHADQPARRSVGRQEGLVEFGDRLAVDRTRSGFPAFLMRGTLGQAETQICP